VVDAGAEIAKGRRDHEILNDLSLYPAINFWVLAKSVDENGDESGLRVEILLIVHSRGRGIAALVDRKETEHEIG